MAAVDKEPPGLDRLKLALYMGDPIGFRHFRHDKRLGAINCRHQRKLCIVRLCFEINANLVTPRSVLYLEHANSNGFGQEALHRFGQSIGRVLEIQSGQGGVGRHCQPPVTGSGAA